MRINPGFLGGAGLSAEQSHQSRPSEEKTGFLLENAHLCGKKRTLM
jgi:hypothetical protein